MASEGPVKDCCCRMEGPFLAVDRDCPVHWTDVVTLLCAEGACQGSGADPECFGYIAPVVHAATRPCQHRCHDNRRPPFRTADEQAAASYCSQN
jgi:hypothetical protein